MSDPLAVSILAKVTSWYSFEGNLNDSAGPNTITSGIVNPGYQSGIQGGLELKDGARGAQTLATPFMTNNSTHCCIGGWLDYKLLNNATSIISLGYSATGARNEALCVNADAMGNFYAGSYADNSGNVTLASYPGRTGKKSTFQVSAKDANGVIASSNQTVTIQTGTPQTGLFFCIAQLNAGSLQIWGDGILRASATFPGGMNNVRATVVQLGNQFGSSNTPCGLDEVFFCQTANLTADEVAWLYNTGLGRTYAQVLALAS